MKQSGSLLTPAELRKYPREAEAGILEELTAWAKTFKTVEIAKRKDASNAMSSKFVAKWKGVPDPKTGKIKWAIRMRLTLRGFEDRQAHLYETYAGTASRLSQRLVASETACHSDDNWIFELL